MTELGAAVILQWLAAGVTSAAFVASLRWTWRSLPQLFWTLFCASAAVLMARQASGGALSAPVMCLMGLLGSFTCSVYWLVARGLFRGPDSVQRPQLWLAGAIVVLLMLRQLVLLANAETWLLNVWSERFTAALGEGITLLSSTVLMLGLWEGCRGYTSTQGAERRLRVAYLMVYGGAVMSTSILPWLLYAAAEVVSFQQGLSAVCTIAVVGFTHMAWAWRTRHPLPEGQAIANPAVELSLREARPAAPEDRSLAQQLRAGIEQQRWYLDPELKVADLAEILAVPDYRVSRAVCAGLGEANFNQWVNRHRIGHACRQLSDPSQRRQPILTVALASGFASLGPFNRAFKAQTGLTPSAFRQSALRHTGNEMAASWTAAGGR